jgi:hypothetical protein
MVAQWGGNSMLINISLEAEQRLTQIAEMAGVSVADYAGAMLEERVYHLTRRWDTTEPPAFNEPLDEEDEDPDALQKAVDELLNRSPEEIERDRLRLLASSRPPRPCLKERPFPTSFTGNGPAMRVMKKCSKRLKS